MFKRLLLCLAFAISYTLWGDSDVVAEQEDKGQVFTVDQNYESIKDGILSNRKKVYHLTPKLDYSYDSHIDIPYDLYGENKHINRRLTKEEQSKYYADPLVYMESVAQTDWQRAFEMSMYYQGWKPNTIFFRFDFLIANNCFDFLNYFNYIPSTDDMRFKEREVIDSQKALHWAKIAYDLMTEKLKDDAKIKDSKTAIYNIIEFMKKNLLYRIDESSLENKDEKIKETFALFEKNESENPSEYNHIYDGYKLYSTMRPDTLDNFKYFYATTCFSKWRNYYCGFVYPKNKEFAIISVLSYNSHFNKHYFNKHYFKKYDLEKDSSLCKINSGLYDKDDLLKEPRTLYPKINFEKFYKDKSLFSRIYFFEENFSSLQIKNPIAPHYMSQIAIYAIENLSFDVFKYKNESTVKSPYFNKAKALEVLKQSLENKNWVHIDSLCDFIKYAPQYGISEEIYNEFVEEIRKELGEDFCKKEEEYAREFFSERIPDPYEYR
ncbi:MAG: hypothetical protein R3Y46_06430 [Opitutales bacterium]